MRILFLSAFYPPYVIGGWEQLVQDINQSLQARGHVTHVLTSVHGVDHPVRKEGVDRVLTLESDLYHYKPFQFFSHEFKLRDNLKKTESVIKAFKPDIIFIHVMWNLSKGVAWMAEQLYPGRVVYYIANDWPYALDPHSAYWRNHARNPVVDMAKQLLSQIPVRIVEQENKKFVLQFRNVLCVSQAIKDNLAQHAGIDQNRMSVIYNGVEVDLFVPPDQRNYSLNRGLSLLYAGSLVSHKGVHTAIEAMAILAQNPAIPDVTLSLIGSGHPDYEEHLASLVSKYDLGEKVHFLGRVSREEMPNILKKFDVLIFPSTWEEPLARVMQEAMAAGLIVVGTLTGGTGELLIEGETGLTFEPANAAMLAQRIEQLNGDSELCTRLSKNGRNKVVNQFSMRRMIDEIEVVLSNIAQSDIHTTRENLT